MSLLISVVICTYNRADLLAGALQTVCEQTLDSSEYEVIVVDNNSTDNTRLVTESFSQRYPNVRYLFDPQPGNSHARNVGWQEAKAKYIAFTDDDCKLPSLWLIKAKEIIDHIGPGVFGGPYFAFYNTQKPLWFKDSYGSYAPMDKAGVIQQPERLAAGNLFIRSDILEGVGGFSAEFGIIGEKRGYAEETALLRYIHTTMPETVAYYDPALKVYHLVRPEKMTWRWLIRDRFTKGRYIYRVYQADKPNKSRKLLIGQLIITSLLLPLDSLVLSHLRNREKQPHFQHYLYESSLEHVKRLGRLYEQYQH